MNMTFSSRANAAQTQLQPGIGFIVVMLCALYGAYVTSVYILADDEGALRSEDFVILVIVFLLIVSTNVVRLLLARITKIEARSTVLLFLFYMLLKGVTNDSDADNLLSISILVTDVGENFIMGFIAFSVLRSGAPVVSRITSVTQRPRGIVGLVIAGTMLFIGATFYHLAAFLDLSPLDIFSQFEMKHRTNNYYQDYGDFMTIAYACLICLQMAYLKRTARSIRAHYVFVLIVIIQTAISFACLQAVDSNKSVLAIGLISLFAMCVNRPNEWLIRRGRLTVHVLTGLPLFLFAGLLAYRYVYALGPSQLRIFDYGESSLLQNSSLQVRWQQFVNVGFDQLGMAPVFGDLSIAGYIHSTLISVQTHLGLAGSLLLWPFVAIQLRRVYRNTGNEGLKTIALPILFVAIISSFFTWGPFWFLMGALYESGTHPARTGFAAPHMAHAARHHAGGIGSVAPGHARPWRANGGHPA